MKINESTTPISFRNQSTKRTQVRRSMPIYSELDSQKEVILVCQQVNQLNSSTAETNKTNPAVEVPVLEKETASDFAGFFFLPPDPSSSSIGTHPLSGSTGRPGPPMVLPLGRSVLEPGQKQRPKSGWHPVPQCAVELPQKLELLQHGP